LATLTSAAIGAVGAGLSVGSAIKQNKLQKQAQEAAKTAAQNLKNIREQNPFAEVQVPTLGNKLAMENINQNAADTLSALQGAGAAGVIGGAGQLNKSIRDAQLDVAARQDDQKYQRDAMQAEAQSGINSRKAERDWYTEMAALEGAQTASSDAQYNKAQALQGALAGLSSGIGELAGTDKFDYPLPGTKRLKRQLKFKPPTDEEMENETTTMP
jgi:hypothetical protein